MIIRGKRYKLEYSDIKTNGECTSPNEPKRTIRLRIGLKTKDRFDTLLHEIIHAALWDLSEEAVAELATDATKILFNEFEIKEKQE